MSASAVNEFDPGSLLLSQLKPIPTGFGKFTLYTAPIFARWIIKTHWINRIGSYKYESLEWGSKPGEGVFITILGLVEIPNFETLAVFRYFALIPTSYWPGPVANCSEVSNGFLVDVGNLMSLEVFSTGTTYTTSDENWAFCHRNLSSFANFSALKCTAPYLVTVFPFDGDFPVGGEFIASRLSELVRWGEIKPYTEEPCCWNFTIICPKKNCNNSSKAEFTSENCYFWLLGKITIYPPTPAYGGWNTSLKKNTHPPDERRKHEKTWISEWTKQDLSKT